MSRSIFTGANRDDYCLPVAYYEAAALAWADVSDPARWPSSGAASDDQAVTTASARTGNEGEGEKKDGKDAAVVADAAVDEFRRERLDRVDEYIAKVAKWDHFLLDTRIGMRVTPAVQTVRWLKKKKGWPLTDLDS